MPTCPFCAEEYNGRPATCPHCGSNLHVQPGAPPVARQVSDEAHPTPPAPAGRPRRRFVYVIAAGGALGLATLVIMALLPPKEPMVRDHILRALRARGGFEGTCARYLPGLMARRYEADSLARDKVLHIGRSIGWAGRAAIEGEAASAETRRTQERELDESYRQVFGQGGTEERTELEHNLMEGARRFMDKSQWVTETPMTEEVQRAAVEYAVKQGGDRAKVEAFMAQNWAVDPSKGSTRLGQQIMERIGREGGPVAKGLVARQMVAGAEAGRLAGGRVPAAPQRPQEPANPAPPSDASVAPVARREATVAVDAAPPSQPASAQATIRDGALTASGSRVDAARGPDTGVVRGGQPGAGPPTCENYGPDGDPRNCPPLDLPATLRKIGDLGYRLVREGKLDDGICVSHELVRRAKASTDAKRLLHMSIGSYNMAAGLERKGCRPHACKWLRQSFDWRRESNRADLIKEHCNSLRDWGCGEAPAACEPSSAPAEPEKPDGLKKLKKPDQ
jgi:hypothetical protein